MAAAYAGLAIEELPGEGPSLPSSLAGVNPLGKIPVLVTDEGRAIYDSRVIMLFLNRELGGKLFPRNAAKRLDTEQLEALADGICDVLLAHVYERRMKPAEKVHDGWLDRQWSKAMSALDHLCAETPKLPARITAGHIALRAAIGYLDLRFTGQWEKGHTKLRRWAERFDRKFPELVELVPH